MKRYIFRIFLCLIAFAILVNSCGDGTDQEQTPVFKTTLILRNSGGQETTTFTNGEQITFVLTIQNLTGSPRTITLPSSQQYDFLVLDANNTLLWRWSEQKVFQPLTTYIDFAPSETKTFQEPWNQVGNNGANVGQGNFKAQGFIATSSELSASSLTTSETRSVLISFVIQ